MVSLGAYRALLTVSVLDIIVIIARGMVVEVIFAVVLPELFWRLSRAYSGWLRVVMVFFLRLRVDSSGEWPSVIAGTSGT